MSEKERNIEYRGRIKIYTDVKEITKDNVINVLSTAMTKHELNRTQIRNNDQIVEAVSAGVADGVMQAMMAVMGGSQQNQAPVIENVFKVDSETLYRMTQKGKAKYDSRYHVVTEF